MSKIVPVNVSVKRYYRVYAHVDDEDDNELIEDEAKKEVIENVESLDDYLDPDLEVEDSDIEICYIDRDGIMEELED